MKNNTHYYISAFTADENDNSNYVWTGSGFDLPDHVAFWSKWNDVKQAKEEFSKAYDVAQDLGLIGVMIVEVDEHGEWIFEMFPVETKGG